MTEPAVPALPPPVLGSVIDLMRTAMPDRPSTADLADHAGYSRHHFTRLFTGSTGVSPGRYLTAMRIDTAKRLLLADSSPVIDIAASVGFDSLSSFGRRFDAMVGVSPGRFRRMADTIGDRTLAPFRMVDDRQPLVTVRPHLEPGVDPAVRPDRSIALWIGWFPRPVPFGLPAAGVLRTSLDELRLPVSPGNPWLLSVALPLHAEADQHLAPSRPLVAGAAVPIHGSTTVDLRYRPADEGGPPMLPALPSLSPILKSTISAREEHDRTNISDPTVLSSRGGERRRLANTELTWPFDSSRISTSPATASR